MSKPEPKEIVRKWEKRLRNAPIASQVADLAEEALADLHGLVKRNEHGFWDLPPIPDYPGARIVIDCPSGQMAHRTIIESGYDGNRVTLEGKFVRALFKTPPDPVPERVERALHRALSCCDKYTGECSGEAVARAWKESK